MRMTRDEFLAWPTRAVTLFGMSGVGKTTIANALPKSHWFHYSADYRIGTRYLGEQINDNLKRKAMQVPFLRNLLRSDSIHITHNLTVTNLEPLSSWLGMLGNPEHGGLEVAEFKRRQRMHRNAEVGAMHDVADFIVRARDIYGYEHFLNDTSGSICEIDDDAMLESLYRHTLLVWLRADEDMEAELIRRAVANPKPLYYRDEFLDARLAEYLAENDLPGPELIEPDAFVQWMFPRLVAHRRPRYRAIAERFGCAVSARDAQSVRDEADFLALVGEALARQGA